jgi:hypothetical protein
MISQFGDRARIKGAVKGPVSMSQNLELPDPIFDALHQAAAASGTSPVGWIAAHLPPSSTPRAANGAKSLADMLAGYIGQFHSGTVKPLSENCGERFLDYLEQKRREGRL